MKNSRTKNKTRSSRQALSGSKQMSFLPVPKFNPKFPSKATLEYRALSLMLRGLKISHLDFQDLTDSWRLAAYVLKLRKLDWPVDDEEISITSEKKPNVRYIKRYFLSSETLKLIKKIGVRYG
ncbi:MAG TPA: hypothetical protein VLI69_03890 [Gammaproteobacteria bacterium]|nr:hypothetical protein [Gammaproteobacteria bacterium]